MSDQKARASFERRENAKFFAICNTCYDITNSKIGDTAGYIYEHMCENITIAQKRANLTTLQQFVDETVLLLSQPPPPPPPPPSFKRHIIEENEQNSPQPKKKRRLSNASA